jgi:inner membrane protein involved in colicin E2 resistance
MIKSDMQEAVRAGAVAARKRRVMLLLLTLFLVGVMNLVLRTHDLVHAIGTIVIFFVLAPIVVLIDSRSTRPQ